MADLVAPVASYGLYSSRRIVRDEPLDPAEWEMLLRRVVSQRITGHLVEALVEGVFAVTDEQQAELFDAHEGAMGAALKLERMLLETDADLRAEAIEYRVLKGPALAHTVYPNPSLRSFGDIDLLVQGQHLDRAIAVLEAAGFRRRWVELRPGFNQRFGKGATLATADGLELDVHRTFVAGPFGLAMNGDDLFATGATGATGATFTLAGRALPTLTTEEHLLHACFHGVLGDDQHRLVPLRDIAQILRRSDLDFDRTRFLARRWRATSVLADAIDVAWQVLDLAPDEAAVAWARAYRPSRREQRWLSTYAGPQQRFRRQALAGLGAIQGVRAKAAYAVTLAIPDQAFMAERRDHYGHRLIGMVRLVAQESFRRDR